MNETKTVLGQIDVERQRFEELPVGAVEKLGDTPLRTLDGRIRIAGALRGPPFEERVVVVAEDALGAGAPDQREDAFGVGSAREEVAEEVECIPRRESHEVQEPLHLVTATVNVSDDDAATDGATRGRWFRGHG